MSLGLANTPLINYFRYKQSTFVSSVINTTPFPVLAVADGSNGQLVITTDDTSLLTVGVAITIASTASYNGNFTVISITSTTFNISGTFGVTETGTWNLATNLTGANAGEPLDFGQVFFFLNSDKITPLDTFSDRTLAVANTNPITLDAVGSAPPIYLQDIPYFIRIIDKFNNLIATLDNYLPPGSASSTAGELPLGNLLPNYGFDTRINENIFGVTTLAANSTSAVSAGWFWEIATTESDPQNTYEYIELGNSNLEGNPKNELVIKSTNNTTGQTVNDLYVVMGDYNKFQDQQLKLSIFTRLQSGAPGTIPVTLVILKNGVPQTPQPLGSINIATLRTPEVLTFTPDPLSTSGFDNDDEMRLVFSLPLNTDFQFAFTGSWLQLSPSDTLSISEDAGAQDAAKEFFGQSFRQLQTDPQFPNRGLPVGIGLGGAIILNQTGTIFQAVTADADAFNFAVSMGAFNTTTPSVELIREQVIKNTQTTRLLDFLRDNDFTQSNLTFTASNAVNVVSAGLGIGAAENTAWNSLAGPRITLTKPVTELVHKVSALATGNGAVRFTFVDNFVVSQDPFVYVYSGGGGNVFIAGDPPSSPMVNWVGGFDFNRAAVTQQEFFPHMFSTTIQPGTGATPAIVDFTFGANQLVSQLRQVVLQIPPGANDVLENILHQRSLYFGTNQLERQYTADGITFFVAGNITEGFIGYNDIIDNPNPQDRPPPHVIRFTIDGVASGAVAGTISTADVPVDTGDSAGRVVASVVNTVNTSFTYEITIVSTPNNGDIVEISNATTDFNLIYDDLLIPGKPVNTGLREAIFVQFNSGTDTATQIAAATVTALERGVMGVPRAADLGLEFTGNGIFPISPTYFMIL